MPLDAAAFRAALARFASGITVLTLRGADGRDQGMTATAFTSLSLDPPLVLVCIGHTASVAPALSGATHVAIHVLAESQEALARRFAQKDADRFEGLATTRGIEGLPLIDGALARLQCRIAARHPGGDHEILVAEVLEASGTDGQPLLYYRSRYARIQA
jgi:flavin reductase ActVB